MKNIVGTDDVWSCKGSMGLNWMKSTGIPNIESEIKHKNVHITISNNGSPISEEKQQAIFEKGYTTKPTGSGLGLHICVDNLKAQNAILRLNKSIPEITEFEIILPIYKN